MNRKKSPKIYEQSVEAGINMYLGPYQILQQGELDMFAKDNVRVDNPYHIYFILRRPKVSYDAATTVINDAYIDMGYKVWLGEQVTARRILFENPVGEAKSVTIESNYPYSYVMIRHKTKPVMLIKVAVLVDEYHRHNRVKDELLDFEVLYIGQAFGKNGKRTALNRLAKHETLQTIYSHALAHNPSSDIWLMVASFEQISFLLLGGQIPTKQIDDAKDFERLTKYHGPLQFSEQQKINFTEAGLIRMFRPIYNIEYKDTFPQQSHKSYKECYDLDINAVAIEVNTSDSRRRLYTKHAKPKYSHQQTFYLHTAEERVKMFDFDWLKPN